MIYVGIDPGVSGGIALTGDRNECHSCPVTIADTAELIELLSTYGESKAVIESVHSMPSQSAQSGFKFGQNYGGWLAMLALLKIPYVQVSPQKWMRHFGSIPKGMTSKEVTIRKNHLKHLAQQRFPDIKFTHKTADAMLLAVYGREVAWAH